MAKVRDHKTATLVVALIVAVGATACAVALPSSPSSAPSQVVPAPNLKTMTEPITAPAATQPVYRGLEDLFPEQTSAMEGSSPASTRWALLIGINRYGGGTENAVGSRQDAMELRRLLLDRGWLDSHIMLLTDYDATAQNIRKSMRWLASKTTKESTVIFHYAGHEMPFYSDVDGDNEYRDVAFWATDNRYVYDGTVGKLMGTVRAKKMWIHLATCRAGGFRDKGMRKEGRVITFSSPEHELSYEDPEVEHSVMGYYTIVGGLRHPAWVDSNDDGRGAIEEAFRWADHRVVKRTSDRQHPFIWDGLDGHFILKVPQPRAPEQPEPEPQPTEDCGLPICL